MGVAFARKSSTLIFLFPFLLQSFALLQNRYGNVQSISNSFSNDGTKINENNNGFAEPSATPENGNNANDGKIVLETYASYWDKILQDEYHATVEELKDRRNSWSKSRLEASGMCIFGAAAEPDSEVFGDKIVKIYKPQRPYGKSNIFRDNYTRGDVLVITPENYFGSGLRSNGKIFPRECLVIDVGNDWMTVAIGNTWIQGLWETRKKGIGAFLVRLDRTAPKAPMKAQQNALDRIRRGNGGKAASILAGLLSKQNNQQFLKETRDVPSYLLEGQLESHLLEALSQTIGDISFKPNQSQKHAITWALQRQVSLIRGPPGTGKTRCAALLISTALKMKNYDSDESVSEAKSPKATRVLAVTHSNGAADVLMQALLNIGVPAVRLGRPSSVSPNVQHRTIVAIAEKIPAVLKLRQKANDVTLDSQSRTSAEFDLRQYMSDVQKVITETAPVVVASCIGANQLLNENVSFPLVVVDEAAQTTEPALTCALAVAKAQQLVLIGDSKQLPPTITSMELRKTLGVSPMSRLENEGVDEVTLSLQYRMPPALMEHPSKYFYNGLVRCPRPLQNKECHLPKGFPWPKLAKDGKYIPLAFVHSGTNNEFTHNFGGKSNPTEANLVINIISSLIENGEIHAKQIAVITPYSKQVQLIRTELSMLGTGNKNSMHHVKVGTVDSFQGQETDLVIFSAVRSNELKEMGFLRDPRRLNVAITRARKGLILIGDKTLLKTCRHWSSLLDSCERRGCMVDSNKLQEDDFLMRRKKVSREEEKQVQNLDKSDVFYGLFSTE